jgi:hypothetical protein
MSAVTLKSLHNYLKLLENASEFKRKLPTASNPRALKEGLSETSQLVGLDEASLKDPQHIAALIGAQRFVMIWGEPSVTDQVARVFDSSRVLLTVLINPVYIGNATSGQRGTMSGAAPQQGGAMAALSLGLPQPTGEPSAGSAQANGQQETVLQTGEPSAAWAPSNSQQEAALESLTPLLSGNTPMACKLFRALFEHMLGFAAPAGGQQGNVSLVNELTGSKEHGRSFLSTALFILGAEVDHERLMPFMMQQGLFGIPLFEHMLRNRDYCDAFYAFRRLERAFMGSPAAEEAQLSNRLDKLNAQFGGKPYGAKIFEADEQDKAKVDAYRAGTDLLEALALTPWCMSLKNAVSVASSNSIRSVSSIAAHFERFGRGEISKDRANQEIADHLLAFASQFSADSKPA